MNKILAALACTTMLSGAAYAHHGSNGQFDMASEVTVTGTITDIKLVNPHGYLYFDVTGADGEVQNWRCELSSGSSLKRKGWSADMFAAGEQVTIEGRPARREEFGCYTSTITFEDGRSIARNDSFEDMLPAPVEEERLLVLADGTPNFAGGWVAARPERRARPTNPAGGQAGGPGRPEAGGPPNGERGAGGPPGGDRPTPGQARPSQYSRTDAGIAAAEGFDRERDNPRFHCLATNIVHDLWFDQHVNEITQTEDQIVIKYGFMDIVRTIHLGMDAHPDDIVPSRAGHSIGSWDGDTLVVDTIGFEEGYLNGLSGDKHSTALHMVEEIKMSEDGEKLTISHVGDDALYLTQAFSGTRDLGFTTDAFDPYECDDLTEEIVKGF